MESGRRGISTKPIITPNRRNFQTYSREGVSLRSKGVETGKIRIVDSEVFSTLYEKGISEPIIGAAKLWYRIRGVNVIGKDKHKERSNMGAHVRAKGETKASSGLASFEGGDVLCFGKGGKEEKKSKRKKKPRKLKGKKEETLCCCWETPQSS